MNPSILDRLVSVLSYFTFGTFSIIWIIFANITRRRINSFLSFNLYQSIFISIILAVISLLYGIAVNLLIAIPYVGSFARWFDLFFNQTPMYLSFTISGFIVTALILYLSIMSLIGKKPYIPTISEIIQSNFGG